MEFKRNKNSFMNSIKRVITEVSVRYKRVSTLLQFVLCLSVLSVAAAISAQGQQVQIQKDIADEIIRFHVLANSDSQEDQNLKLKVKEEVVRYLQKQLSVAKDVDMARAIIKVEKSNIERIARDVIIREGYEYSVTAKLVNYNFPMKRYGDLTFPAGEYEALRVLIGNAEGKNWWCVMYPSLCFINETYSIVPVESKDQLKYVLSEEDYNTLLQPQTLVEDSKKETELGQIEIKFKLFELLKNNW